MTRRSRSLPHESWEQVPILGTTHPNPIRPGAPEWVRLEIDQYAKYATIYLDTICSSYEFRRQTAELQQFVEDYREYLAQAYKSGQIPKRKSIEWILPGGSYCNIQVLKQDSAVWAERMKKLVHLGNLELTPGAAKIIAAFKRAQEEREGR